MNPCRFLTIPRKSGKIMLITVAVKPYPTMKNPHEDQKNTVCMRKIIAGPFLGATSDPGSFHHLSVTWRVLRSEPILGNCGTEPERWSWNCGSVHCWLFVDLQNPLFWRCPKLRTRCPRCSMSWYHYIYIYTYIYILYIIRFYMPTFGSFFG